MPVSIGQGPLANFDEPIKVLMDCHRRIEKFLGLLLRVADEADGSKLSQEQRDAADAALRYFTNAAPHHTLDEEQALFPAMRRHRDDPRVAEALRRIEALEAEHDKAEALHERVAELMSRWLEDGALEAEPLAELKRTLTELRQAYARHIAEEDEVIFPLAAEVLAREALLDVGREMAERRGIDVETNRPRCRHAQANRQA